MLPRFYEVSLTGFYPAVDGPRADVKGCGGLLCADELNPLAACCALRIKTSPDPPGQNDFLNINSDLSNLLCAHLTSCRGWRFFTASAVRC